MNREEPFPTLPGYDHTMAFLREGYVFVGRRCSDLRTDGFRTRLMLRPVTCLRGPEAVREFYRPGRMTRQGAMPGSVVALLQDKGSVQTLDGTAHAVRKAMFLDLMTQDRLDEARRIFREEWEAAARSWQGCTVVLRDAVGGIMTRTALRWCGLDVAPEDVAARATELSAMIGAAGSLGPAHLRARVLRIRSERWARGVIRRARREGVSPDSVLSRLAAHRDADGRQMSVAVAAVELLNLLRPIVAVGRFIVFTAHALHVHRGTLPASAPGTEPMNRAIADEVRRHYPFFPLIGGCVLDPFDWRGVHFAKGEWLLLDLYGTNRHPEVWPSPERFLPERHLQSEDQPEALVPQGGGSYAQNHRCPGEWLTVALMTEATGLLRNLSWEVPEQDLDLPLHDFPPWPSDGMKIAVAPSTPGASC
ncbi:cytochrome P450 [Aquicoccus sp. SCR17]|nr:cytochrome P450 [Carideicomes alvinocaridis]